MGPLESPIRTLLAQDLGRLTISIHTHTRTDGQTPYVNEYELKALLTALKELYKEPLKPTPLFLPYTYTLLGLLLLLFGA